MHLAFLTPEYPLAQTSVSAGLGNSIKNLATALVTEGVKVSVFVYSQKKDEGFVQDGINFHLIRHRKYCIFGWLLHRKHLQNYLNRIISEDKIDLVEAPDWTGITAFMNLHCPLVIRMNGSDAYFCDLEGRPRKRKNYWFEKNALTGADHLVSVSQFTASKTAEIFKLRKKVSVIPNGVDIGFFSAQPQSEEDVELLYFGSIIRKKGVLELAHIFNLIVEERPHTRLLLIGRDIPDVYEKKSTLDIFEVLLSPTAKENFRRLPAVGYEDVRKYIASASVVVLPSFAEALPMTWLEAMAMKKALVTSNIGWAKEIMLDGETGFTEDPKDHKTYATKILRLLDNENLRLKMGKAARVKVEQKFSTDIIVKQNINFYQSILIKSRT